MSGQEKEYNEGRSLKIKTVTVCRGHRVKMDALWYCCGPSGGGAPRHYGWEPARATGWPYRSAPQVANLGGQPVQPPFKIPESIIYYFLVASDMRVSLNIYVPLNVTKFDRHFFV